MKNGPSLDARDWDIHEPEMPYRIMVDSFTQMERPKSITEVSWRN